MRPCNDCGAPVENSTLRCVECLTNHPLNAEIEDSKAGHEPRSISPKSAAITERVYNGVLIGSISGVFSCLAASGFSASGPTCLIIGLFIGTLSGLAVAVSGIQ